MLKFLPFIILFFSFFISFPLRAEISDFVKFYDIDLEHNNLPPLKIMEENLINKYEEYDVRYKSFFDLLGDFDSEFYTALAQYGSSEKRLKFPDEDRILDFFNEIPKIHYQYFGPMLFELPYMSEKVLNLPGIKETKNKFPTRIAKALKDVKDLEFLSPDLYNYLMPEKWGEYSSQIEYPQKTPYYPKTSYDKNFYASLQKLIKPEEYMPGFKAKAHKTKSDLRTLHPTKDSLITSADVKAFVATFDEVNDWANQFQNHFWISRATILLADHEKQDAIGQYVPSGLKDIVNPCSRFVQKVKLMDEQNALTRIVLKQGFNLNEWAYTCDKTIKAYRLLNIDISTMQTIRTYKLGVYEKYYISNFTPQERNPLFAVMQAVIQAYKAPLSDVMEVKKNRDSIAEKLKKTNNNLFGLPIFNI